ncbi:c-type cytochrome [Pararhodobacter sp.]|uniref:c-type cytochrome n=1 Tax=Pararhodobacter sp. TaxID=2127056 RepID=UPI002FE164CA
MSRTILITLAVVAGLGALAGASVVGFGLYNVSAQSGHLPGVSWLLHTTFRHSVRLRAQDGGASMPDLTDPDLIALGAGHFATGCLPCHAAPGRQRAAAVRSMLPEPPPILEAIEGWGPSELHWIIQNGARMTGMPAWPAENRPDEVWSVVAYLEAIRPDPGAPALRIPDTATLSRIRDPQTYCATCHEAVAGPVPDLSLLSPAQIEAALRAFASGQRPSGIMQQAVSQVRPDDFAALAAYFGAQPQDASDDPRREVTRTLPGASLAQRGTRDVPACHACHGPGAAGSLAATGAPLLDGQREAYLARQLHLWREGVRTGSALMTAAARDLTDAQIAELARWYADRGRAETARPR